MLMSKKIISIKQGQCWQIKEGRERGEGISARDRQFYCLGSVKPVGTGKRKKLAV